MTVGARIKKLREINKISVKELSKKSNISSSYLYQLERGDKKYPSVETLNAIADVLGVKTSDLITKEIWEEFDNIDSKGLMKDVDNISAFKRILSILGYNISESQIDDGSYVVTIITPSKKIIKIENEKYTDLLSEFREYIEFKINKLK